VPVLKALRDTLAGPFYACRRVTIATARGRGRSVT
jgi:hypothetical protein